MDNVKHYRVARVDELAEGSRKVVSCNGIEVGVFNIEGELFAWFNNCPHMRGPVCQGRIFQRVLEPVSEAGTVGTLEFSLTQKHIVCPWHGFEFDLRTGQHPGNPRHQLRKANTRILDGEIYVVL
jgi:nitrite reductase/ring-hydroxylating ferredoxin subunit